MTISNKLYDTLKFIAQIVIPAIGAFYFGLAQLWGLPYGEQIVGTLSLIDALLGTVLGISTYNYNRRIQNE